LGRREEREFYINKKNWTKCRCALTPHGKFEQVPKGMGEGEYVHWELQKVIEHRERD